MLGTIGGIYGQGITGGSTGSYYGGYVPGSGTGFYGLGTGAVDQGNEDSRLPGTKKPSGPEECQTCKNRKYVDGSDEGNVSFKSPGHISPESSKAVVSAHENMHVSNARREGNKEGAELVSASVTLRTAVCPECGTPYIAGGTTRTAIKYTESNPYEQNRKLLEGSFLKGSYVDAFA